MHTDAALVAYRCSRVSLLPGRACSARSACCSGIHSLRPPARRFPAFPALCGA